MSVCFLNITSFTSKGSLLFFLVSVLLFYLPFLLLPFFLLISFLKFYT
jgi:hypothetical protein